MKKRYRLEVIGRRQWLARSRDHALELARQHVRDGETWRVTVTVGAGWPSTVYAGVGRRDLDAHAGVVDEAAG